MTPINKVNLQLLEQLQQWANSIVCRFIQVLYLAESYLDQRNKLMEVREELVSCNGLLLWGSKLRAASSKETPAVGDGAYVAEPCSSNPPPYQSYGATILKGWLGNSTRIAIDSTKQKLTTMTTAIH
jgi:hypothetical protein